jgi:8-hydroxy-5-deazaflavin:NADPH oxidoreductase
MKIGILGTGTVGQTVGGKLVELGHEVKMGARDAANAKAAEWTASAGPHASHGTFAEAAAFGEVAFNCTKGEVTLEVARLAGEENLAGKVLVDVANPLDFSRGFPPSLAVCNTDSLGEQLQRALPRTRVVKALNTMWCGIMVDPRRLPDKHVVFVCGDDAEAKATVRQLLAGFGWRDEEIVDLGDISGARGTEMLLPIWLRLYGQRGDGGFNFSLAVS